MRPRDAHDITQYKTTRAIRSAPSQQAADELLVAD
jgi:hypothetical protein